jgi:type I restriction enzyme R subunit
LEDKFSKYIKNNPQRSKNLKKEINKYFHILNLIQFVIDLEKKYQDFVFLEFWKRYSYEYNALNGKDEIKDEIEIYFDDHIGIVKGPDYIGGKTKKDPGKISDDTGKHKYDILKILEKKNQEEEVIGQSIIDFELKIDGFFNYIKESKEGKLLIAKIFSIGIKFTENEVIADFEKIYHKFIRRHRLELGEFFIKQTEDIVDLLYVDFEKEIRENLLNY